MSHQFEVQLLHATIPIEALRVWRASSSATLKQLQNIDPPEFSYSLHVFFTVFSICQNLCSECLWPSSWSLCMESGKACGCRLVCFHVLQLLSIRFTQRKRNLCRMSKLAMKHQQGLDWRSNFTWLSYGYWQCIFVDFWTEIIDPPNCFHYSSVE